MRALTILASLAITAAVPAQATTIALSAAETNNDVSFYQRAFSFVLPTGAQNVVFNLTNLLSDDAVVAQLNGTTIGAAGIFGPGTGQFTFNNGATFVSQTFAANGPQAISINSGFLTGSNALLFTINNNNQGINAAGGPLTGGPSQYAFDATVTFDQISAAPEPAAWGMMIVEFGLAGAALRRRPAVRVTFA